jgi:hypothetical protein
VKGVGPFNPFPQIPIIFQYSNTLQLVKYKKVTFSAPKFSKLGMVQYKFERNKLPFWEKFKFPIEFELKI